MTVCKDIKTFSRTHERVADIFSLLAVVLLFASIWVIVEHHAEVMRWMSADLVPRTAAVVAALVLDVALILGLLMVGSARFGTDDERCFGTFHGRRNHRGKIGLVGHWIAHMENVGKRHR